MTQPRLLFDECLGKPHVERLNALVELEDEEYRPVVEHLLTFQEQGVWDEDWVPRVKDGDWIIVSSNRSRFRKGKGEPLSRLCVKYGITHVFLSPGIERRRSFEKMMTILSVWYPLLDLVNEPKGLDL